jgi:hypothetical protein
VLLAGGQHLGELPGVHGGRADIAGLAGLHDVGQGLQGLLDRRLIVEAVDLVEVHIVGPQALQAGVDAGHDVLARQALVVGAGTHRAVDLGGDHHLFALGEFLQRPAGDLLGGPLRVDVGGVEEVDPVLDGGLEERLGLLVLQHPGPPLGRAIGHAAEAEAGDLQAGFAQTNIIHGGLS